MEPIFARKQRSSHLKRTNPSKVITCQENVLSPCWNVNGWLHCGIKTSQSRWPSTSTLSGPNSSPIFYNTLSTGTHILSPGNLASVNYCTRSYPLAQQLLSHWTMKMLTCYSKLDLQWFRQRRTPVGYEVMEWIIIDIDKIEYKTISR